MKPKITLSENLVYLIKEEKRSLSTLAREAGMNKSTLHGYMMGVPPRSLESLVALAQVLKIDPAQLLFGQLPAQSKSDPPTSNSEQVFEITIRPISRKSPHGLF